MKRSAAGDNGNGIGFLTWEMGTVIKFVDASNSFFKRTLAKMANYLNLVHGDTPAVAAFEQAFGMKVEELDTAMWSYRRRDAHAPKPAQRLEL